MMFLEIYWGRIKKAKNVVEFFKFKSFLSNKLATSCHYNLSLFEHIRKKSIASLLKKVDIYY